MEARNNKKILEKEFIMLETIITATCSGLVGALLSALITVKLTYRNHKKEVKWKIAEEFFGYRYQIASNTQNKDDWRLCVNKIPIVFRDNENVIDAWHTLYDSVRVGDTTKADEAIVTLMKEICKDVGINTKDWNDNEVKNVIM